MARKAKYQSQKDAAAAFKAGEITTGDKVVAKARKVVKAFLAHRKAQESWHKGLKGATKKAVVEAKEALVLAETSAKMSSGKAYKVVRAAELGL